MAPPHKLVVVAHVSCHRESDLRRELTCLAGAYKYMAADRLTPNKHTRVHHHSLTHTHTHARALHDVSSLLLFFLYLSGKQWLPPLSTVGVELR